VVGANINLNANQAKKICRFQDNIKDEYLVLGECAPKCGHPVPSFLEHGVVILIRFQ
jgi:hypothetical protein